MYSSLSQALNTVCDGPVQHSVTDVVFLPFGTRPLFFCTRWWCGILAIVMTLSLENLAAMEETVVRDKAVESACVVIGLMQGGQQEVRYIVHAIHSFQL